LYDILGKTPEEATAYLQSSPGSFLFRSMRVVEDVSYNPITHDLAKPDDFVEGRTTIKIVNGVIADCEYEYGSGFKMVYLKPSEPPPPARQGPELRVLEPDQVFVLPVRKPLQDRFRRDIETRGNPSKGWYIKEVVGMSIINPRSCVIGKKHPVARALPKKPTVSPFFYEMPW